MEGFELLHRQIQQRAALAEAVGDQLADDAVRIAEGDAALGEVIGAVVSLLFYWFTWPTYGKGKSRNGLA